MFGRNARCVRAWARLGVAGSLWGAVVSAGVAGTVAFWLPPVNGDDASWTSVKGDD